MSSWGRPTGGGFFLRSRPYREPLRWRLWHWLTDRHHDDPASRARCGGCPGAACHDCPTNGPRSLP